MVYLIYNLNNFVFYKFETENLFIKKIMKTFEFKPTFELINKTKMLLFI